MIMQTGDDDRQSAWDAYRLGIRGCDYYGAHEDAWRAGKQAKQQQHDELLALQAQADATTTDTAKHWSWQQRVEALLRLGQDAREQAEVRTSLGRPAGWRLLRSLR